MQDKKLKEQQIKIIKDICLSTKLDYNSTLEKIQNSIKHEHKIVNNLNNDIAFNAAIVHYEKLIKLDIYPNDDIFKIITNIFLKLGNIDNRDLSYINLKINILNILLLKDKKIITSIDLIRLLQNIKN